MPSIFRPDYALIHTFHGYYNLPTMATFLEWPVSSTLEGRGIDVP